MSSTKKSYYVASPRQKGEKIPPHVKDAYFTLRRDGFSQTAACRQVGISRTTAWSWEKGLPTSEGGKLKELREGEELPAPLAAEELGDLPRRALADFGLFRFEVLGRRSDPWQEDAAYRFIEHLQSDERTFVVLNVAPGSGKTTLFTHDIPAWLIARDRTIRCLIGSRTDTLALQNTRRLKRTLERKTPVEGANACAAEWFGRFKPGQTDLWQAGEFIVEQLGGTAVDDKEATVFAAGQNTGFLGGRFDFNMWDDLVTRKNTRTVEMREDLKEWWGLEAETRVEPGGMICLMGQRISADDLFRTCIDMPAGEVDEIEVGDDGEVPRKYHHIVYKAHYDEQCDGDHARDTEPWTPDGTGGCLLSPHRLGWRQLAAMRENDPGRYQLTYQQEDADLDSQLVRDVWVTGGIDDDGAIRVGCYDDDRRLGQPPPRVDGLLLSVATVDPSPTQFWAIQWWLVDIGSQTQYLMDGIKRRMQAPELLDRMADGSYQGVMESWQRRSEMVGYPISHWVVEQSVAQRFILQYDHFRSWMSRNSTDVIPHDTHANKTHEDFGVQSTAPHWKYGRVRLPRGDAEARRVSDQLVSEATKWPQGATDDQVMAHWFLCFHLDDLAFDQQLLPRRSVPGWVKPSAQQTTGGVLLGG